MLNMTGYWCEVLLLLFVDSVLSSHFMGATIRWKSDPDIENKATFYWKAGWRISRGPCSNSVCTAADIGRLGTNRDGAGGKDMYCHIGCSDGGDTGMLANSDYWITAVSVADNYEMGENEFTHTFAGSGPYKVGLGGLAWRSLSVSTVNNPSWRILTTVIFGDRSDTGRPNNSPMTAAFPIYNLQFDCEGKIKLPLLDPDGDKVRCRWGNTYEECGDVCDALPGVVIDEDTCELTITPATASTYVSDGWYVGAIMLEDFPQSTITLGGQDYTPTDPLSAVPLAFLVKTPTFGSGCAAKPVFVSPTPEPDTVYYLEPFQSIGISMYAVNEEDTNAAIEQIDIVSPSGVVTTELVDDDQGRTGVKYRVAYWTPSLLQAGGNTLCFMALDTTGKFSEYQCVYIYAHDVDECLSDPCQNGGTCNNLENIYTCTCPEGVEGYNCETIGSQLQTVYEGCYVDGPDRAFPHSMVQLPVDNSVETCTSHCFDAGGYEYASLQYTQECWCGDSMELAEIYGLVDESECSHQCPGDVDQFCGAAWRGNLYRIELNCWSSSTLGRDYIGRVSTTVDGIECQRWDTNNDPHSMLTFSASDFPEDTMTESENYCRNPDDDTGGPWCYSKDVGVTWDYCDIPQCIEIECSGCDIDECADSPCHNHGTCIDGDASYTCNCVQGYEGTNCETLTDMCDPQPCQNSGTCYNIIGEYLCICEEGYTGDECQTDIDDCASSPCYNGGTCTDDVAGFSCSCVSGWSGSSCQDYDDPCSSSPCQNGGTCQADCSIGVSSAASYTCVCGRHYSGFHCVEATTTSTTESTTSTSTSTTTTATPTSTTLEPTTTTETDHCASLPCLNDGLCTGYDDGYTCTCLADYCGAQCETEIPPSCYNSHCSCSVPAKAEASLPQASPAKVARRTRSQSTVRIPMGKTVLPALCVVCGKAGRKHGQMGLRTADTDGDSRWCTKLVQNTATIRSKLSELNSPQTKQWLQLSEFFGQTYFAQSNLEWTGFGLDVSCNCTECNSGESNTTTVLEGHTTCYRNIYVLILTGLCGVILSTVCFTTYILVLDLRRRYNVLLNGSNPDVKYNGYGSSTSLRGLIQADSRMSNNSVTKVGVAEKPRQPGNTKTDYDDPQAMMRQYLMNDTSNAFLFSGGQRSTTSSSKGKASGLITIDDGVDSLMEESIREENDDVIKERGENKRKKDKKDKKEKKKTDEKKESKKKDKKERRKGWD